MSGLQKKDTNFFGCRRSTKSRSSAERRIAAFCSKKSSGFAAPLPRNAHSKSRFNGPGVGISKSHETSSHSSKAKVVKGALSKLQGSGSKSHSHSKQQNLRTKKLGNSIPFVRQSNLATIGMSTQQKQPNDASASDDAEREANGKLTRSNGYQKFVMWCAKLGVFVTMLGQLGFIIYIFVIDILRDEIPTSTGLVLSLTHLVIIFLSLEVIFYATKTLCLFTCLADLLAILASFIYIVITESSNNYLRKNVTATQSTTALHQAVFATAESCILLMFNLCMVLRLYTKIRSTSLTETRVAVMRMDLESADQERERRADLKKGSLTQKRASGGEDVKPLGKMATLAPMKTSHQALQSATTDRSSAFSKSPVSSALSPELTSGKEIPATVPASVLPGSKKSTTSQKPFAVAAKRTTPGGSLGSVQMTKLVNETPEAVTAIPQQARNTHEKPIASTIKVNATGTSIAQNIANPADRDPSRVAVDFAPPSSFASGATPMRYLYEEKQKTNQ